MNNLARPLTIKQLAGIALENLWDESKELKSYLRMAEKLRKEAQTALNLKDYEAAFVKYASAASLVMEYMPQHRDYLTILNAEQRNNLNLNGLEMMARMGEIKPILIKRIADWDARPQEEVKAKQPKGGVRFDPDAKYLPSQDEHWRAMKAQKMNVSGNKNDTELRRVAALDAAQKAAAAGDEERLRRQRQQEDEERDRMLRQQEEERAKHVRQQEEMRQREEEIRKRREMQKREQEEIAKRRMDADGARREILQTISANNPGVAVGSRPITPPVIRLPLESPAIYDGDTTDSDSPQKSRRPNIEYPTRLSSQGTPVTTASLPPAQARIQYPQLMTQHQQRQGYMPSESDSRVSYPTSLISRPSSTQTVPPYGMPQPQPAPVLSPSYPSYPGPSRPAPPLPQPPQQQPLQPQSRPLPQQKQQKQQQLSSKPPRLSKDGLRQVNVPRECLSRFVNIATVNTNKNLETCGLLLGLDRGHKFAVTTLLIPKQHATSDTCTMDEEELVMQFTEARGLITLGWIHTHPTQSCFMSSVDLHTHAGFQCMLRESFAVVCAPKSTPNFGIFRLTDPPGLETVLKCEAKDAFHPHPDLPIYTDADKGHVMMKDFPLEIVDLR